MDHEIIKEKLKELSAEISEEYGDDNAIRANIAAINDMLIRRGRGEELYKSMTEVRQRFKEK